MVLGGFENPLPVKVKGEQRSYVRLTCATTTCQEQLKLRIKAPRRGEDLPCFELRCCGQIDFLVD